MAGLSLLLAAIAAAQAGAGAAPAPTAADPLPVFVWRLEHAGRAAPAALLAPFGGTNVEGTEDAAWVLERGLEFYVGHAPGRDALHLDREAEPYAGLWERWYAERDPELLLRTPCLSAPETAADLERRLGRSLAARGGASGWCVSLGDEVGLTPYGDPLDLCASPTCRAAWNAFWRADRARLGAPVAAGAPAPWPDTDAVRRALVAGEEAPVGAWLARRRFHQEVVLERLAALAAHSRELCPDAPVALFGMAGRTAFGGLAVERALGFLDVLEAYAVGDARELLHTLRGPEQRALATVFPDGSADGPAWQVFDAWLRGADALVLWCDRDLARDPAYARRLARAVGRVRALRAAAPGFRPRPAGVALVHSPDSIALTWLGEALRDGPTWPRRFGGFHEQHGARERDLRAWLRVAEDTGRMPGSLPLERLGPESARAFPLLVASHLTVVGPAEERALAAHLAAGGSLLVQGPFAERDALGRPTDGGALERLRAAAPERVERADAALEARLDDYLELRRAPPGAAVEGLRAALSARLASAGVPPPPLVVRAEPGGLPWLVADAPGARAGERWVALLPNAIDPAQRAGLVRVEVAVEVADGLAVEWLHPRPDDEGRVRLAPGDGALLRLRPR